jgi:hypothetical protein
VDYKITASQAPVLSAQATTRLGLDCRLSRRGVQKKSDSEEKLPSSPLKNIDEKQK